MISKTQLNDTIKEICLPSEALSIYPNHCEWVEKCISEHRTCFLVQELQTTIGCAIIKVSRKNPKMIKLCFLYVLPDYRRKGNARELIFAVEQYATSKNFNGVYTTANPKANSVDKFICSCGYEKIGKTKHGDFVFQRIFES